MTAQRGDEHSAVLIVDGDRERAGLAAQALMGPDRLVLTAADAVLGMLVGKRLVITSMMTEAQIAGRFTFDGLDAVAAVHRATPDCRIFVTGEQISDEVAGEALRRGASEILLRPFDAGELRTRFGFAGAPEDRGSIVHIPTMDELVASDTLRPVFQKIIDLDDAGREAGFESLARYDQETPLFGDPAFLFEYARLCGRTAELDLACLRRTMWAARSLPARGKIFINVHPRVVADGDEFARTVVDAARTNDIALDRVVLEITEQERLEPTEATLQAIEDLRAAGVQFALDDVGMSYSHLNLISQIRPAYLKIAHEFGTNFEKDPARGKIIRNIQSLARDFECEVILEGVETEETSRAAAAIGARYAQGFFYGMPAGAAEA